jgi:cobalamin biosynthesis protein CobC
VTSGSGNIFHGGEPPEDEAWSRPQSRPWLDLSTGISPIAYPFSTPAPTTWQILPRQRDEQRTLEAAGHYFGIPDRGNISMGAGSQALLQTIPGLLPPGNVAVFSPTYAEHAWRWAEAGHSVVEIIDLDNVAADCRYVVLVNPNNPTGETHDPETLLELATLLADRGGYLVVDEAFCDVTPAISIARHVGQAGLLVLRSFGKFFGLAGLRIGFLLGPSELIAKVREKSGLWPVNGPALAIAKEAYEDIAWIEGHRKMLAEQAVRLCDLLTGHGQIIGGTDLFVLLATKSAPALLASLAAQKIHVRHFPENPEWLRFGLPDKEEDWARLASVLNA